ncbi:MAG: hypothetical protein NW205_12560 [Hyphomicrobiaceae bacterium]|nr:hypothetical protein [Hyphomicrobiaceae bacterium]
MHQETCNLGRLSLLLFIVLYGANLAFRALNFLVVSFMVGDFVGGPYSLVVGALVSTIFAYPFAWLVVFIADNSSKNPFIIFLAAFTGCGVPFWPSLLFPSGHGIHLRNWGVTIYDHGTLTLAGAAIQLAYITLMALSMTAAWRACRKTA